MSCAKPISYRQNKERTEQDATEILRTTERVHQEFAGKFRKPDVSETDSQTGKKGNESFRVRESGSRVD